MQHRRPHIEHALSLLQAPVLTEPLERGERAGWILREQLLQRRQRHRIGFVA